MSKFMAKQRESRFDDYDGRTRKVAGKGKSTRILIHMSSMKVT